MGIWTAICGHYYACLKPMPTFIEKEGSIIWIIPDIILLEEYWNHTASILKGFQINLFEHSFMQMHHQMLNQDIINKYDPRACTISTGLELRDLIEFEDEKGGQYLSGFLCLLCKITLKAEFFKLCSVRV